MPKFYVYILVSSRQRHYLGYTSNLEQRISQHNRKHKGFTGTTEKWELLDYIELMDKQTAMKLERYLKSLKNISKAEEYLQRMKV